MTPATLQERPASRSITRKAAPVPPPLTVGQALVNIAERYLAQQGLSQHHLPGVGSSPVDDLFQEMAEDDPELLI